MTSQPTANPPRTTCSIIVGELQTRIFVLRDGKEIDSIIMDLGYGSVIKEPDCFRIAHISDGGETFLDAVAKRIHVGDQIDERMFDLIGELIGETILGSVCRRKPPQVSQRLLATEPLREFYEIDEFELSGALFEMRPELADSLAETLASALQASLTERGFKFLVTKECT